MDMNKWEKAHTKEMRQAYENIVGDYEREQDIIQEIHERYPDTKFPKVFEQPVQLGRSTLKPVFSHKAIVGNYAGEENVFAFVSKDYPIVPFETIIYHTEQAVKQLAPEFGNPVFHLNFRKNGAVLHGVVNFPEAKEVLSVRDGDAMVPQLLIESSHNMSKAMRNLLAIFQMVCSNGLVIMKEKLGASKQKHTLNCNPQKIAQTISERMVSYSEQIGLWKSYAEKKLEGDTFLKVWKSLPFGSEETPLEELKENTDRKAILGLKIAQTKSTVEGLMKDKQLKAWDLHNAVTQYLEHEKSLDVKEQKEVLVEKAFSDVLLAA